MRGLYKSSEKRKHDLEEEKREMVRIDQAAQAAFAQDVGSGLVRPGSSSRPTTSSTPSQKPTATKPSKPSNPWANYTTAASLGYTDPDEERIRVEMERRRTQGVAGEWEVVEPSTSTKHNDEANSASELSKKREAEGPPDSEDARNFKLRKKVAPLIADDWDADLVPIKLKPRKVEEASELTEEVKKEEGSSQRADTGPVKWTSRGWKRPEDEPAVIPGSPPKIEEVEPKPVAEREVVATVPEPEVSGEPEAPPVKVEPPAEAIGGTGAVFRKRRFGGNRGKR